jgi:hypothetical protein
MEEFSLGSFCSQPVNIAVAISNMLNQNRITFLICLNLYILLEIDFSNEIKKPQQDKSPVAA